MGPVRFVVWLTLLAVLGALVWWLSGAFPGSVDSDFDRVRLIWLVTILALASSSLIVARRFRMGETLRNIAIWAGLIAALVLGFTYQDELRGVAERVRSELLPGSPATLEPGELVLVEGVDGHFHVDGEANGTPVRFLIDTGASDTVLSPMDAERLGVNLGGLDFSRVYATANGDGRGAPFRLMDLAIGPIVLSEVAVSINETPMSESLLGMSFLRRLKSFEVQGRRLYLRW
jgi:aspartyl protease family protein